MSIITKKKALESICEFHTKNRNGRTYTTFQVELGTRPISHERVRISRSSRHRLEEEIERFYKGYREMGDVYAQLSPAEIMDAKEALSALKERQESSKKVSLVEVARFWIENHGPSHGGASKQVGEAYAEYLGGIPEVQDVQRQCVMWRVGKWAEDFGSDRMLSEVNAKDIVKYLDAKWSNPKSWNNQFSYVKTFLNWCCSPERKYLDCNPVDGVKAKPLAYKEPKFIKVGSIEKLVRELEELGDMNALAFVMLSFFAGIRFAEIERLNGHPEYVNREGPGSIRIAMPKGWTKGVVPRVVPIQPNVKAWMDRYGLWDRIPRFSAAEARIRLFGVAKTIGVKMEKNVGRHSFVTYHIAAYNNGPLTETICGTSKDMRAAHYMGLASKADAEAYFAIMPKED